MHDMDDKSRLTPQEKARKAYERRAAMSASENAQREEFNLDSIALMNDPDAEVNSRGSKIRGNRSNKFKTHQSCQNKMIGSMFEDMALANIKKIFENMTYMASFVTNGMNTATVAAPARVPPKIADIHPYQDDLRVYDTRMVSAQTARKLYEESEIIAERLEELEATKDPVLHHARAQVLMELVDEYEMVQHPRTGMYIHSAIRVDMLEEINNAAGDNCLAEVCIFHMKADIASSRGIKRTISDVYNDNPEEVELTQAEQMQQQARPVAPPHLKIA